LQTLLRKIRDEAQEFVQDQAVKTSHSLETTNVKIKDQLKDLEHSKGRPPRAQTKAPSLSAIFLKTPLTLT
jgi:hypothetical protein